MRRLHFIVNPAAGGNTCLPRFRKVEESLSARGIAYTATYSEYAGHASELARSAPDCDCIVAVGGDGTVREIASELVHTDILLGIMPFGTGNDLMKALGIPVNLEEALQVLLEGKPRRIDAAAVNDDVFLNVAGFGFDVDVLQMTRLYKNKFRGRVAYILGILHALFRLQNHRVRLYDASGVEIEEDVLLVAIGNGRYIGGGMQVTPLADTADGQLDVCVVTSVGRLGVLRFLVRFMRGNHLDLDFVRYFRSERLEVASDDRLSVQMDGEIIGETPAVFRVLANALCVVSGAE